MQLVRLGGGGGADALLGRACATADVVLDHLWGQPTADALDAVAPARADDDRQLTRVQVGSG